MTHAIEPTRFLDWLLAHPKPRVLREPRSRLRIRLGGRVVPDDEAGEAQRGADEDDPEADGPEALAAEPNCVISS